MLTGQQVIIKSIELIFNYQKQLQTNIDKFNELELIDINNLTDKEIEDLAFKIFSTGLETMVNIGNLSQQYIDVIKAMFNEVSKLDEYQWN